MREVKVKGKKGTTGISIQRYGDDLTKKTPRQPTPAIPETEVAQQMVNGVNPEASIRHQISTNNGPVTSAEKVYLPVPYVPIGKTPFNINGRASSPLIVPEIEKQINVVWDGMKKEKQAEQQLAQEMVSLNEPPFYSLLQTDVNGPGHFSIAGQSQIRPTNSNYGELGYIMHKLDWDPRWDINAYNKTDNFKFTPMYNPHYPRERLYYKPDAPNVVTEAPDVNIGTGYDIHSSVNALTGAGALTGSGLVAYPFLTERGEDENINEIPVFAETPQAQTEPTLKQQYVSQSIPETDSGIWGEKLNKLAHLNLKDFIPYSAIVPLSPFLNKEAFRQPQTVSSNFNDLVKSIYGETPAVPSELPANISQDNFVAPKELPAEGQTLDDYNRGNQPQEGVVLASQDTGSRVLNAPTEKKAVRKAIMPVSNKPVVVKPVQSEDRLTEANLASAMVNKAVSPQVLQYGSPYYLQENKPVDMRQWVRQKYGMSMSPAEMVQRGIMPYEYLQYW